MALKFLLTLIGSVGVVSAGVILPAGHISVSKTANPQFVIHPGHSLSSQFISLSSSPSRVYQPILNIQDSISENSGSQRGTRDGHYSLIDADSFKRRVQYTSDSINGYTTSVNRRNNVKLVANEMPIELPYVTASAQEIDYEPVVKGAYSVRPIVRAVPIAYPISKGHRK